MIVAGSKEAAELLLDCEAVYYSLGEAHLEYIDILEQQFKISHEEALQNCYTTLISDHYKSIKEEHKQNLVNFRKQINAKANSDI